MRPRSPSVQYMTPRLGPRPTMPESNVHRRMPVAASSATTLWVGVSAYSKPLTTSGLVCRPPCSPESYVQATSRFRTFERVIWLSGEWRLWPGPPYTGPAETEPCDRVRAPPDSTSTTQSAPIDAVAVRRRRHGLM